MSNQRISKRRWYAQYEKFLSIALIADAVLFVLFLLFSGLGILWAKVTFSIVTIVLSVLCMVSLYLTGEFRRHRSRYLVYGFGAVVICVLFSLICRYPAPAAKAVTTAVRTFAYL